MTDGRVRGWVIDSRHPCARVAVHFGDTAALGRVVLADSFRADVQAAGLSDDGYCGFAIAPGSARKLLYAKLSPVHRIAEINLSRAGREPRILRRGSRVFAVDRAGDWTSGYALDLDDPELRRVLELRRRDGSTSRFVACRYDARARPTPAHDGFYGFRAPSAGGGRLVDAATGELVVAWDA